MFVSKCLLIWRHFDMSSVCLFRRLAFLAVIIWYFSDKHRLHRLEPHLRAGVVCRIFHLTAYSTLVSFSAQILFESQCPLDGNCMQTSLVYEAEVINEAEKFRYIRLCEGDFKTRFNTHKSTFRNRKYCNSTELSKRIWALKDTNVEYAVKWKILQTTPARRFGSSRCSLCLSEKYHIITAKKAYLLNKRTELMSKCRHINKHLLKNTRK